MSSAKHGISTLVTHGVMKQQNPQAHISPIYQSSAFRFESVEKGAAVFQGQEAGFIYSRMGNPNYEQVIDKIAALEGMDITTKVTGHLFASGMAAIHAALMAAVKNGETIIAQQNIYGSSYSLLNLLYSQKIINVVWLLESNPQAWEDAFAKNPNAYLAYVETPSNPNLSIVDIKAVAQIAHQANARLLVDNTFASPYCQRPFNLGADIVVHSTTKYLCGHGVVIGGIVLSNDSEWVNNELYSIVKLFGATPSPFDAWLTDLGLKTFELRMQRHCENAAHMAGWLQNKSSIAKVFYPGLPEHPGHAIAKKQMQAFGGMLAFELIGGIEAGVKFMNHLNLLSIVPTLGNVDTLLQHPASMSHVNVPREDRLKVGVSDGLIRVSVGIENIDDLLSDLEQALEFA